MLNWIRKLLATGQSKDKIGYINTQFAFIRSEPSFRAFVRVAIPMGERVEILYASEYFYYISSLVGSGWVAKTEVTIK